MMTRAKAAEIQSLMSDSDETEFSIPEVLAQRSRYSGSTKRTSRTSPLITLTTWCLVCRRLLLIVMAASVVFNVVLLVIVSRTNCYVDIGTLPTLTSASNRPDTGAGVSLHESSTEASSSADPLAVTSTAPKAATCGEGPAQRVEAPTDPDYVNVFRDLISEEIISAVRYVQNQAGTVHSVELHVPKKEQVLSYLDRPSSRRRPSRSAVPDREALVTVEINNSHDTPTVQQWIVGPLPHPSLHSVNPSMSKSVPSTRLTNSSYYRAYEYVLNLLGEDKMDVIMRESFDHSIMDTNCGPSRTRACFIILGQKVSFGLLEQPSHVFTLNYDAEFPTIHSLPLQIIVSENTNSTNSDIFVRSIYFAGSTFQSLADFTSSYKKGKVYACAKRTIMPFVCLFVCLFFVCFVFGEITDTPQIYK